MKKIYCFGVGLHTYVKNMVANPPKGYEFVVVQNQEKANRINWFKKNRILSFFYKNIIKRIFNPFNLINKTFYETSPENTDLIFSHGQLISEEKPWVVEILDTPISFAGYDYRLFEKNLKKIERILASKWCKKIIVHIPTVRREFEHYFSKKVLKKVEIIPPAILPNKCKKKKHNTINFLFMGSINNPDDFYIKGGLEVLGAFKKLSEKYNNIKLFMRCKIPKDIKKKYLLSSIEFLETEMPQEKIKELYLNSDILFFPGHFYFLMAFLESMSYGLPILAIDRWGVADFFENNKNAFLVPPSKNIPYPPFPFPYFDVRSKKFIDSLKNIDEEVIKNLCEKASVLIENKNLREKMGRESLKISKEKFSLKKRNKRLKEIFDEAINGY